MIRSRGGAGEVPIIALTASALPEDMKRCFEAGMNQFVTKPVTRDQLVKALLTALSKVVARIDGAAMERPAVAVFDGDARSALLKDVGPRKWRKWLRFSPPMYKPGRAAADFRVGPGGDCR